MESKIPNSLSNHIHTQKMLKNSQVSEEKELSETEVAVAYIIDELQQPWKQKQSKNEAANRPKDLQILKQNEYLQFKEAVGQIHFNKQIEAVTQLELGLQKWNNNIFWNKT